MAQVSARVLGSAAAACVTLAGAWRWADSRVQGGQLASDALDAAAVAATSAARDAENAFGLQVHAWKNVLLRSYDPAAADPARGELAAAQVLVDAALARLADRGAAIGLDPARVAAVAESHGKVGAAYRAALARHDPSTAEGQRQIDAEVRGVDRPMGLALAALSGATTNAAEQARARGLREREAALILAARVRLAAVAAALLLLAAGWWWSLAVARRRQLDDERAREQATAEVKKSEEKLRGIFESIQGFYIRTSGDGRIELINPLAVRRLGYERAEELLGRPIADALYADPGSRSNVTAELRAQGSVTRRLELRRKDGGSVTILANLLLVRGRDGGPDVVEGFGVDLTGQARAEAALRESEERAQRFLDAASVLLIATDEQHKVTLVNHEGCRILGYTEQDLKGLEAFSCVAPEDKESAWRSFRAVLSGVEPEGSEHESHVLTKLGARRLIRWRTSVVRDGLGHSCGAILSGEDITDRRRAEEALQKREAELAEASQIARLGHLSVDYATSEVQLSHEALRMLGLGAAKMPMPIERLRELIHPDDRGTVRAHVERSLSERRLIAYDHRVLRPDGEVRQVHARVQPDPERAGRVIGTIQDITERKQQETELVAARAAAEEASRVKSQFLANMSHEIRTPMNAIVGLSQVALRAELPPEQRRHLETIQSSARTLLGILNDILDFSKIEAGKLHLEATSFQLDKALEDVSNFVAIKAEEKGLELLFSVAPDVPRALVGDPLRLTQVLVNLAANGVKFTERGEVLVSVALAGRTEDGARLRFAVRDTGIGLTPAERARLFQPFTQGEGGITRKFGGTGLGLAISKELVARMGGELIVESEPGKGSTFSFTIELPVAPEASPDAALFADLRGLRVLVVDDNASAREILQVALRSLAFEATAVDSGPAALQALAEAASRGRPFGLVLLDWQMPGMDGVETARRIRADVRLLKPPLIFMVTAHGRDEVMRRAADVAPDAFLGKPVSRSSLLDALMEALGRRGLHGAVPPASADRWLALRGMRVLVVEDNEINQRVARAILEQAGLEVEVAPGGREALELLRRAPARYAAVLMDAQMPEMDGYETTRAIRGELGLKLPIIALTAHAFESERQLSLQAGMDDHVVKPIDTDVLLGVLLRHAARGRTPQALPAQNGAPPPGIDLPDALRRLGGNRKLLDELVGAVKRNFAGAADQLRASLAAGDRAAARSLAHELRGVAANVSARALAEAAARLETALAAGEEARFDALVGQLEAELRVVVG